jgi:hypothetical protein
MMLTRKCVIPAHCDLVFAAETLLFDRLLQSLYDQVVSGIASARRMTPQQVEVAVNTAPLLPHTASSMGLLDGLLYRWVRFCSHVFVKLCCSGCLQVCMGLLDGLLYRTCTTGDCDFVTCVAQAELQSPAIYCHCMSSPQHHCCHILPAAWDCLTACCTGECAFVHVFTRCSS